MYCCSPMRLYHNGICNRGLFIQNWLNKAHRVNVKKDFLSCNKRRGVKQAASEIQNLVFFNRAVFYFRKFAKFFKLTCTKAEKVISS